MAAKISRYRLRHILGAVPTRYFSATEKDAKEKGHVSSRRWGYLFVLTRMKLHTTCNSWWYTHTRVGLRPPEDEE